MYYMVHKKTSDFTSNYPIIEREKKSYLISRYMKP